jgi:hypothetical protein
MSSRIYHYVLSVIKFLFSGRDESVKRIIRGKGDAGSQFSLEKICGEVKQISDIPTRDVIATTKPYQSGFVPIKSVETSYTKPVAIPAVRFKPVDRAKEVTSDTQTAQTQLQLKCARLELECDQLRKDRDSLNE